MSCRIRSGLVVERVTDPRSRRRTMNDKHPRWLALYVLCLGDLMIVLDTNMSACSPFMVNEGAGWVGIDLCGTPLIPSDARGSTDVDVVQAQLVQEAVRAPGTGWPARSTFLL
jgi:hypothetical protein